MADQITVVQIQNGKKIEVLTIQAEFRYISGPFLAWSFRMEVPVEQIRYNLAHFSLCRSGIS